MSSRSSSIVFALCMLAAAAAVWLDHSPVRRNWRTQTKSKEQAAVQDFEKYHEHTFTVLNIVDGDTVDINIPDGKYEHTRVRLLGVDAPETKHPEKGVMYFGPEAADFTAKSALGKQVTVYLEETRTRDKYNRLLAYIKLPDGEFLNESLLNEGFAYADVRFRHSFYYKYQRLESVARGQKKGLWLKVTPEQMPRRQQEKKQKSKASITGCIPLFFCRGFFRRCRVFWRRAGGCCRFWPKCQ
jgi:endonuclease YncB( thermonuclease family)